MRTLLRRLVDFFAQRRLARAQERHRRAADNLDAAVRELIKK